MQFVVFFHRISSLHGDFFLSMNKLVACFSFVQKFGCLKQLVNYPGKFSSSQCPADKLVLQLNFQPLSLLTLLFGLNMRKLAGVIFEFLTCFRVIFTEGLVLAIRLLSSGIGRCKIRSFTVAHVSVQRLILIGIGISCLLGMFLIYRQIENDHSFSDVWSYPW